MLLLQQRACCESLDAMYMPGCRQSYMVCQSWLPAALQAQHFLPEACTSMSYNTSPATSLRGFSSQGLAETPLAETHEEQQQQEQQSKQPLARYVKPMGPRNSTDWNFIQFAKPHAVRMQDTS